MSSITFQPAEPSTREALPAPAASVGGSQPKPAPVPPQLMKQAAEEEAQNKNSLQDKKFSQLDEKHKKASKPVAKSNANNEVDNSQDPTLQKDVKAANAEKPSIKKMPADTQSIVIKFLTPTDLIRASRACRAFNCLANNELYWKDWCNKLNIKIQTKAPVKTTVEVQAEAPVKTMVGVQAEALLKAKTSKSTVLEALTCQRLIEIVEVYIPRCNREDLEKLEKDFRNLKNEISKASNFNDQYLIVKEFIDSHSKLFRDLLLTMDWIALGSKGFTDIEIIPLIRKSIKPEDMRIYHTTTPILCSCYAPAPAKLPLQRAILTADIEHELQMIKKDKKLPDLNWLMRLRLIWTYASEVAPDMLLHGLRETHAQIQDKDTPDQNKQIMQSILDEGITHAILMSLLYGIYPERASACLNYSTSENRQQILETIDSLEQFIPQIAAIKRGIDIIHNIIIPTLAKQVAEHTIDTYMANGIIAQLQATCLCQDPKVNQDPEMNYEEIAVLGLSEPKQLSCVASASPKTIRAEWKKYIDTELPEGILENLKSVKDYQKQIEANFEAARKLVAEFQPQAKEAVRKDAS